MKTLVIFMTLLSFVNSGYALTPTNLKLMEALEGLLPRVNISKAILNQSKDLHEEGWQGFELVFSERSVMSITYFKAQTPQEATKALQARTMSIAAGCISPSVPIGDECRIYGKNRTMAIRQGELVILFAANLSLTDAEMVKVGQKLVEILSGPGVSGSLPK